MKEHQRMEWKESWRDEYLKWICGLCLSCDGGRTYRELLRQEYNFSPPGTTFEREKWTVSAEGVTHLRLVIKPDKGDKPCRATLTSFVLR